MPDAAPACAIGQCARRKTDVAAGRTPVAQTFVTAFVQTGNRSGAAASVCAASGVASCA